MNVYITTHSENTLINCIYEAQRCYLQVQNKFRCKIGNVIGNIRDILDSLLLSQKETIDEGSDLAESLTDAHLVGTISDLFGAGTDTTIITLHWTLAIMAEYQDIQKKVAMEIEEVIGHDRLPSLEDRGRLPYAEATMMEVLRFSSILPLGLPHATTCDVMLGILVFWTTSD
ncbi:cytochrome P450 2K6-like [Amphiura filiformis]|uniref:cytochrome P450 2K6-like n=1 Tax=Amphiura filiformis TaxID=82378 RepID=UPI003B2103AC